MLKISENMGQLNHSALMALYEEGNRENAADLYPDLFEGQALLRAEQDFYDYLRHDFFQTPNAFYAVWEENGEYLSALRLEPYKDGMLLEALETHPQHRRKGYAQRLIEAVLANQTRVYSHVGKKNRASLGVHEKCGFRRISEQATYIDGSVNSHCCTLLWEK